MCINSFLFGFVEAQIADQRILSVALMTYFFLIAAADADMLRFIPIISKIMAMEGSLPVSQAQY